MTETVINATFTERIYALLAYTSTVTILAIGGYILLFAVGDEIMSAPWQIVLAAMTVPILAAAMAACGNHREKARVRAATWGIVVPLGIVNPIAWLGAFIILARLRIRITQQHATGD
jgi:hypothetical protein